MITKTSIARVSALIWITSLLPTEQVVTRRIHEDLTAYLDSIGLHHETFAHQNAEKLLGILARPAEAAIV